MAGPSRATFRSALRRYSPGIALVLAWLCMPFYWPWIDLASDWLNHALFSGLPHALAVSANRLQRVLFRDLGNGYEAAVFCASVAVGLGVVLRMVARARIRAGQGDPLDRVRRFVAAHPRWTSAATAVVPALLQGLWLRYPGMRNLLEFNPARCYAAAALLGVVQWRIAAAGLRALLAPTVESEAQQARIEPDDIRFAAVAVTRETLGMVGGFALLSIAAVVGAATMNGGVFNVMLAYIPVAALSALAFRQASRISIGVDGVRVGGTSRTRFFAYRDLDEVREQRGDVLLVRRGRTLLRLQLHGQDATRRAAVVDRIRAGIARVAEVERDGAANLVKAVPPDAVARSMRGGADYRMPSVSRDGLWALVEGAAVDADARTAAARAILETGTTEERSRIRVAAGHCADPQVRVALEELADDDEPEAGVQSTSMRPSAASR